jgi:hypothetical protein
VQQMGNPIDQSPGFPGTGTCDHEEGSVTKSGRGVLLGVQLLREVAFDRRGDLCGALINLRVAPGAEV